MTFDYDPNTGVITLKNPDSLKLKFSPSFVDFLGVPGIVESDATISNLKAKFVMYVHCDLVDPARNLLNGKKSNLLVLFQGFNPCFSQMSYHSSNRSDFRCASTSRNVRSVTLSVKDEDGELINFCNQKFYFELIIE